MASQTRIRLGTASPSTQATTALTLSLVARLASRAAALGVDILALPEAPGRGLPARRGLRVRRGRALRGGPRRVRALLRRRG